MEKKLEGLRFGFDERTGAISVMGEPVHEEKNTLIIQDDPRASLLKATTPPLSASFPQHTLPVLPSYPSHSTEGSSKTQ